MAVEVVYVVIPDKDDTLYRVIPNPDAAPGDDAGVVIQWSDDKGKEWMGHFFVSPDAILDLADALKRSKV